MSSNESAIMKQYQPLASSAANNRRALWTLSILTIPGRERYLENLVRSLNEQEFYNNAVIVVVYNRQVSADEERSIEQFINQTSENLPIEVYFNQFDTSIVGGRNFQLNLCKTPLIVFIDDDVTLHEHIFPALLQEFLSKPVAILGVPSKIGATEDQFKPRSNTPFVTLDDIRFMPVQGMMIATYRKLLVDVGGFNTRRQYWGEWTELNLRLWRWGYPTGYMMNHGFLRHWEDAPDSPTRSLARREQHVVWGLICTALEYNAVDTTEATEVFWQLVQERYLAYSFGDTLSAKHLLQTVLSLMPQLSAEWSSIVHFQKQAEQHPFQFMPFHNFTEEEVRSVLLGAKDRMRSYQADILFSETSPPQPTPKIQRRTFSRFFSFSRLKRLFQSKNA